MSGTWWACMPAAVHGRDDKQIRLPGTRLSGAVTAGSYSVVTCCVCRMWLPAALFDQIKSASASLSLGSLTSNKYLGYMPLLSRHTVNQQTLYRHLPGALLWILSIASSQVCLSLYPLMISNTLHIAAWIIILANKIQTLSEQGKGNKPFTMIACLVCSVLASLKFVCSYCSSVRVWPVHGSIFISQLS